jgi:hypothetical protein
VALFVGSVSLCQADASSQGTTHALLINGGWRPQSNYLSHLHHLQDTVELLTGRGLPRQHLHIFSADGQDASPDLAVRDAPPTAFWLLADPRLGRLLQLHLELSDTHWDDIPSQPACLATLRTWFETAGHYLAPGDRLLIFVTDHDTRNRDALDNGTISLWYEELTVAAFNSLLARLRPGVQIVMVISQ